MLHLIDLDQPRPGFRRFISSWVLQREDGRHILVDPGPRSSVDVLLSALADRDVHDVSLILLTHVHLDHAGGIGEVVRAFPAARVWVHPDGAPHLVDPRRLWKGSLQILGEVAQMYGEPTAVPADRLVGEAFLVDEGIRVIPTPGHAPHHACFVVDDVLFVGEALGARLGSYMRAATPPRWSAPIHLASIDRLDALDREPPRIAFAHHGEHRDLLTCVDEARRQIRTWIAWAREDPDGLLTRILAQDPWCGGAAFAALDADVQERERYFLSNSVAGVVDQVRRGE